MRISVFIATSLDGFIARPNGDIDWLGEPNVDGEDFGYGAFIAGVDCLVMGRNTYEKVLTFGDWPYDKPVVVMSRSQPPTPDSAPGGVEFTRGAPAEVVAMLRDRGCRSLYIDGGAVIQSFLRAGLITRLIISTIPVLIGEGVPLFGPLDKDLPLRCVASRSFPNGIVQTEYAIDNPGA